MNKKYAAIMGICALCAIGAIGCGVWYTHNNPVAKERAEFEERLQNEESTAAAVEVPTENVSAGIYEIKTTPSEEAADEALYAKIGALNTAAKEYYDKNRSTLLSIYGMMYSDEDNYTVSASKVMGDNDTSIDDYADVLLIRPSDLAEIEGISLKRATDKSLKPFTAYNSSDGYIISSYEDEGGIITREQYRAILGGYAADHGAVRTPGAGQEEFDDIAACAATALGANEYDIKYIACDDKYAVAVIGGITQPNDIREYVFIKKPGGWSMLIEGLEKELLPRTAVNAAAPDMELGLLPKYTIARFGEIKTGFVEYEQSLIKLGMITEADMPETYSCGTGRFAYIELTSGKKLLGVVNDSNQLEFYEVEDTNKAIAAMLQAEDTPPIFILKYNR